MRYINNDCKLVISSEWDSQIVYIPGGFIALDLSITCLWRTFESPLLTRVVPILSSIDASMMTPTAPPPSVINYHFVLYRAANKTCNHVLLLNCFLIQSHTRWNIDEAHKNTKTIQRNNALTAVLTNEDVWPIAIIIGHDELQFCGAEWLIPTEKENNISLSAEPNQIEGVIFSGIS